MADKESKKIDALTNVLVDLRREQNDLSNSINSLKANRDLLEQENEGIKRQISLQQKKLADIQAEKDLESNEIDIIIKEKEAKQEKLNKTNSELEAATRKLSELSEEILRLEKDYDRRIEVSIRQISQLESKANDKIIDLDNEFVKFSKIKEKESLLIEEKLIKLKKQDGTLQAIVNSLIANEQDLRSNIVDLEKEKEELNGIIKQSNETLLDLISKNKQIENLIRENGTTLNNINSELKKTREDLKDAKVELNRVLSKVGLIQKKEDALKSFEAYIIETSDKYGLEYQPYEG